VDVDVRCTTARCSRHAAWRVSVPLDPWPLQYACEAHLAATVQRLGGDCRVVLLVPGTPTPGARSYLPLGERGRVRVESDERVPPGRVRIVADETIEVLTDGDPAAGATGSDPPV
jgi:hypothetical protein